MNHGKHLYLLIGLVALGGVLWITGVASSGLVGFLLLGGCAFMMFFMMRGMGDGGQHGGGGSDDAERLAGPPH